MLSPRESFKREFVRQCELEGLTKEAQILDRISQVTRVVEKIAADAAAEAEPARVAEVINQLHGSTATPGGKKGEGGPSWPLLAAGAVGVPLVGGAALGVLGSHLKGNWLDEEDVKNEETLEELRRQIQLAKQYRRIKPHLR
jgi:hypothetical protein